MEYFIVVGNSHDGPFTIEQFKEMNLSPDTYVWRKGLEKWTLAKELPELATSLWTPPAPEPVAEIHSQEKVTSLSQTAEQKIPPTYLVWSIITTIFFFLPLGIVAIIFSSQVKNHWRLGQYDRARKDSECAAWFSICAFVCGLILIPFQLAWTIFG